jgi:hypothetical protein
MEGSLLMASSRWTQEMLDEAGRQGDDPTVRPNADDLAAQVMSSAAGIHRQNELLQLVDLLMGSTALALTEKSVLRQKLAEFPPEALRYFEPAPAPDWLDERKLRAGAELWRDNSLACVGALYALSLPACYLCEEGVPALYATAKLENRQYIFQRVYETGLFADDVLDEGGFQVLEDYTPELYLEVLKDLDPEGDWTAAHGGRLTRAGGDASPDLGARVAEEARKRRRRFLWGRGFLAARKVRFLHASIRFMLLNPDKLPQRPAEGPGASGSAPHGPTAQRDYLRQQWSRRPVRDERLRDNPPINQEQLAMVLLTFGYMIPLGLERWGCRIPRPQKDAFLHLWKVVGHVMGIREDLMTDDWDEAKVLLDTILARQAFPSDAAKHMTSALMDFMRAYLPHLPAGLRQRLPAHPIIDQLSQMDPRYPDMILPAEDCAAARKPLHRLAYGAITLGLRLYYRVRNRVVGIVPVVGDALVSALHRSSEELIASWRDQFRRRPFEVSGGYAWVHRRGASPQTEKALMRWRSRLFNNLGFAVLLLFLAVGLGLAAAVVSVLPASLLAAKWSWAKGLGLGAVVSVALSWLWMNWQLPRVLAKRPDTRPEAGATA